MTILSKHGTPTVEELLCELDKEGIFFHQFPNQINIADLVREIGGVPLQNNLSDNSIVWNVTPMSEAKKFVRSHGMNEFTLHTDASYETNPPRYVGLFVVREDLNGGGLTLASDSKKILQHLSPQSLEILKSKHHFKVPPEYRKSVDEISGAILFNGIIRYRREIILNPSDKVIIALNEFDNLARNMQKTIVLRTNMLLILDNHRFLHGRTQILDDQRHLLRIKFNFY